MHPWQRCSASTPTRSPTGCRRPSDRPFPWQSWVDDPDLLAELRVGSGRGKRDGLLGRGIKHIRVLPVDLTEESGHLTPTLKLKRAVVMADFAADVDAVYSRKR